MLPFYHDPQKMEITFKEFNTGYIITSVPDLFGEENNNQRNHYF